MSWLGFDGRIFLLKEEWVTFQRRMAVRYAKKRNCNVCEVCGMPANADNPLTMAHVIGFNRGILEFGLTPEFLDSETNLVVAHRKTCNASVELASSGVYARLKMLGVCVLPDYLPENTRMAFQLHVTK